MRAVALVAGTVIAYTVVLVLSWRARLFYVRKDGRPDAFRVWARFAAWTELVGPPAWDPDFNSADLPMLMRIADLPPRYRRHFLGA